MSQSDQMPPQHRRARRSALARARARGPLGMIMLIALPMISLAAVGLFLIEAGIFEGGGRDNPQAGRAASPAIKPPAPLRPTSPRATLEPPVRTPQTQPPQTETPQAEASQPASPSPTTSPTTSPEGEDAQAKTADNITVLDPKITRFDKKSRTYIVEAKTAERDPGQPDIVRLKGVKSEVRLADQKNKIFVTADRGVFNNKTNELKLSGAIEMRATTGYSATLKSAHLWLNQARIISNEPVIVYMPEGAIAANGLDLIDSGKRIRFLNRVRMDLNGRKN